jgi:hypothetical protein
MALLFMDGFDHYVTANMGMKWTSVTANSGTLPAITTNLGRRSGGAALFAGGYAQNMKKVLPASVSTLITGFAFQASIAPAANVGVCWWIDGSTTQLTLVVTTDLRLAVYRGASGGTLLGQTSANAIATGAYAYIEFKATFHGSAGTAEVRVNGTVVLTLAGVNTIMSGNASANALALGSDITPPGAPSWYFDDLYVLDTTGSANNTYLGDARIDALLPNADGTYTAFTPSSGSTHYTLVNESAPDTTSYVASATVGAKDTYQMQDLGTTNTIAAVQVSNAAVKDNTAARSISNLVRSGSTDYTGASTALTTTYAYYSTVLETDPATSAAWTQTGVNGMQAGSTVSA